MWLGNCSKSDGALACDPQPDGAVGCTRCSDETNSRALSRCALRSDGDADHALKLGRAKGWASQSGRLINMLLCCGRSLVRLPGPAGPPRVSCSWVGLGTKLYSQRGCLGSLMSWAGSFAPQLDGVTAWDSCLGKTIGVFSNWARPGLGSAAGRAILP